MVVMTITGIKPYAIYRLRCLSIEEVSSRPLEEMELVGQKMQGLAFEAGVIATSMRGDSGLAARSKRG
jgi:hypothetical protein